MLQAIGMGISLMNAMSGMKSAGIQKKQAKLSELQARSNRRIALKQESQAERQEARTRQQERIAIKQEHIARQLAITNRRKAILLSDLSSTAKQQELIKMDREVVKQQVINAVTGAEAKALAAASGTSGVSQQLVLSRLKEEGIRELEWIRTTGHANYELVAMEGKARVMGTYADIVSVEGATN